MRLFFGVEIDGAVRTAVSALAADLGPKLSRTSPGFDARWIPAEHLHVTVWFLGEVSDTRAESVMEAVRPPLHTPVFLLVPTGCGAFPRSGAPRVIWIGLREGAAGMAALHDELGGRLTPLGILPERRPYTAHLTIALVKHPGRGDPRGLREVLAGARAECGVSRVSFLTLFRSRLSPRGAAYEPLVRVPLHE